MPVDIQAWQGRAVAAALLLAVSLGGCSSVVDNVPSWAGGLPEGVPARPTQQSYPAVHDMPPQRQDSRLSDAERQRLRQDLSTSREKAVTEGADAGAARNP